MPCFWGVYVPEASHVSQNEKSLFFAFFFVFFQKMTFFDFSVFFEKNRFFGPPKSVDFYRTCFFHVFQKTDFSENLSKLKVFFSTFFNRSRTTSTSVGGSPPLGLSLKHEFQKVQKKSKKRFPAPPSKTPIFEYFTSQFQQYPSPTPTLPAPRTSGLGPPRGTTAVPPSSPRPVLHSF